MPTIELFGARPDPRRGQGRRFALAPLLTAMTLAMLCSASSCRKMEAFIRLQRDHLNALPGTHWKATPSYGTLRDLILAIDSSQLEAVVRSQSRRMRSTQGSRRYIAIDGKALRGSADRLIDQRARQLLSALDQADQIVLGQWDIADKTNEIPVALHCQKTRQTALQCGAHAVVQVKDNQPELGEACKIVAEHRPALDTHEEVSKGHGRIEQRTTHVFKPSADWLPAPWLGLVAVVVRVQRHVQRRAPGNTWTHSQETAFYIATLALSARDAAQAIRGHWKIENALHYVRDVTLREDHCRVRRHPEVLARLGTLALNILRHNRSANLSRAIFANAIDFERLISLKGI